MEEKVLSIKKWAEEDRPREKLLLKGKATLSEAELIGILLGSGTTSMSAVDLAKQLLIKVDYNLNLLAKLTVKDLMKFKGIGEANLPKHQGRPVEAHDWRGPLHRSEEEVGLGC